MSQNTAWIVQSQSKGIDFLGGIGNQTFVTINMKESQSGLTAEWFASEFQLNLTEDLDKLENSVTFQIKFIVTEPIDNQSEVEALPLFKKKLEALNSLLGNSKTLMPISSFKHIEERVRIEHWLHHRKSYLDLDSKIGIQRRTVIDYLILQSLGLKDFASHISKHDKVKMLTVRDRLAYARRNGWLKKPGVGIRTSYMIKEK